MAGDVCQGLRAKGLFVSSGKGKRADGCERAVVGVCAGRWSLAEISHLAFAGRVTD